MSVPTAAKRRLYKQRHTFRSVLNEVGCEYRHGGQIYVLQNFMQHINRWGRPVTLAVWQSRCLQCGGEFETALRWGDAPRVRRCLEHRRPSGRLAEGVAIETLPAPLMATGPSPSIPPVPAIPDASAALAERLELLTGVMLDLGAAIESMAAESKAARHESRQINERLAMLLRSQIETRRQLGQTSLHIPPRSSRRRPLHEG